jgi:glycosyltransferase involved in cell wall biosynthesis
MKNLNNIFISVITINYNGSQFIERCINSVLMQIYDNWEHIILDCGSSDDSLSRLRSLSHPRLIIKETNSCSVSDGRNLAISYAKGNLCAILDIDDIALPNRLLHQANLFKRDPSLVCVGGNFNAIIYRNNLFKKFLLSNNKYFVMPSLQHEVTSMLNIGLNPIVHSTLMFAKPSFFRVGGYRKCMEKSEDFDLVLRLSRVGKLASSSSPVSELYFGVPNSHTVRHRPHGMGPLHFVFLSLIDNLVSISPKISHEDTLSFLVKFPEKIIAGFQCKLILRTLFGHEKLSWDIKKIFITLLVRNSFYLLAVFGHRSFWGINSLESLAQTIYNQKIGK